MIVKIRTNAMGTISFTAKFLGMRKEQEFIVYQLRSGDSTDRIMIQSDTRIGYLYIRAGNAPYGMAMLSKPHASGAYSHHIAEAASAGQMKESDCDALVAAIRSTASARAGKSFVKCDNSEAALVGAM